MSLWQNWPGKRLMQLAKGLLKKRKNSVGGSSGDRHVREKSTPAAAATAPVTDGRRVLPRRSVFFGGLAIAALILVVVLHLGMVTIPGVYSPGGEWNSLQKTGQADENITGGSRDATVQSGTDRLQPDPATMENQLFMPKDGDSHLEPDVTDVSFEKIPDGGDFLSLPPPGAPLSGWRLHTAFGDYTSETLPSGGILHRRNQGAFLEGAPGAAVSALWDGIVLQADREGFPCGSFVVLEHEGGYSTLYGNLRQIWVGEGDEVSRGENIGLLPSTPTSRENGAPVGTVPFRTVIGGRDEHREVYSAFHEENPLLYLELRKANRYLDPFLFIEERN
ncbi:MAG: murein hydrolase activator EnvC family protein [Dethiobacteria bacterium]|jgi:hypothetical protein